MELDLNVGPFDATAHSQSPPPRYCLLTKQMQTHKTVGNEVLAGGLWFFRWDQLGWSHCLAEGWVLWMTESWKGGEGSEGKPQAWSMIAHRSLFLGWRIGSDLLSGGAGRVEGRLQGRKGMSLPSGAFGSNTYAKNPYQGALWMAVRREVQMRILTSAASG